VRLEDPSLSCWRCPPESGPCLQVKPDKRRSLAYQKPKNKKTKKKNKKKKEKMKNRESHETDVNQS
jgi:hypothetical protein